MYKSEFNDQLRCLFCMSIISKHYLCYFTLPVRLQNLSAVKYVRSSMFGINPRQFFWSINGICFSTIVSMDLLPSFENQSNIYDYIKLSYYNVYIKIRLKMNMIFKYKTVFIK